jgi:ABC-type multidrug transport system ATPase subunit
MSEELEQEPISQNLADAYEQHKHINEDLLKVPPMKLSWKDVTYKVKMKYSKKEKEMFNTDDKFYEKEILKPQHGYVDSGETLFIMGSSGAGKTTLLNALCDRISENRNSKITGEIMVNDTHPVSQKDFGKYGAYVMQDDVLFPTLTCEEAITFAAQLKMGESKEKLKDKINAIIESLGLLKCRHTLIGSQMVKGLSGGERKRTAIGVELITDPSILFLDEPTSGLDSFTANKIVKLLVEQSRLGKAVISTIHQPSSGTYALFDRLLLLMDGHCIYQGPGVDAADYFSSMGFVIPKFANPADYFLKEFYMPFEKSKEDTIKLEKLVSGYQNNQQSQVMEKNEEIKHDSVDSELLSKAFKSTPWFTEL